MVLFFLVASCVLGQGPTGQAGSGRELSGRPESQGWARGGAGGADGFFKTPKRNAQLKRKQTFPNYKRHPWVVLLDR